MRLRRLLLTLAAAASGCLSSPELRTCAEFEFGTEGCGTPCEVYCDFMIEECGDIYASRDRCINDCANEPVSDFVDGTLGDRSGNSLACRLTYAVEGTCEEASLRDSAACAAAGCTEYCDLMIANCEGAYPSVDNCLAVCAALPRGASGVDANTVECRFDYATLTEDDAAFCDAASMGGGGVCGDVCQVYCDFIDLNCTGANAVYADRETCERTCALMDTEGGFDDWDFSLELDTVQCRLYHAGPPAALEPGVHCNHARVYNSVHCGIDPSAQVQPPGWACPTFCDVVMSNCPGTYADDEACLLDCELFPEVVVADPARGPDIYPVSSLACPM